MRYQELVESMSFSAGHKDPEKGYWVSDNDPGDMYEPDAYKADYPYDKIPKQNPDYNADLDLTLSNASMRQVFDELGYGTDLEDMPNIPIDEFIAKTTQWLQKAIGKPSPKEPVTIDKSGSGATMISGGKPEGYFNRVIKQMNYIARDGKQKGATHVWAA